MRRVALYAVLVVGVLAAAAASAQHQSPRRSAEEWARIYNDPARDAWQKPEEVLKAVALRPDEIVADIGAGAGYFTQRLARRVAKVYAVDIDEGLLKLIARDAPPNVETILAPPDDPRLADASVDTAFFCNVVHHIRDRVAYYQRLAQALRPGGRIVVIDFYKKALPVGPPLHAKLTPEEVTADFAGAGFRLGRRFDFLPYQYFLVFQR